jgi:hypothetical protein
MKKGTIVWTLDPSGRKILAEVLAIKMMPVPAGFQIVKVTLADGRVVIASLGHPVADDEHPAAFHSSWS